MDKSFTLTMRKAMLDAMVATGGPLETPTLILLKNTEIPVGPRMVMADLTECDFSGYAAVAALEFGAAYTDPQDNVLISAPSVPFAATAATIGNVVTGWALVNAGKTVVHYAEKLEETISVNEAGDGFLIQPTVKYGL